jgi:hypothetical protein
MNVCCVHNGEIETFYLRYLQIYIYFQIKKPFVIHQPSILAKKREFPLKRKTLALTLLN